MFSKTLSLTIACVTILAWLVSGVAAEEAADKADVQARETAEKFMQAMKGEGLDAVMKLCAVPFFWDGKKNIKDLDELKQGFSGIFGEKDLTQLQYEIKEVHTYPKIVRPLGDDQRDLLKEVLADGDRIVIVSARQENLAVLVRLRDGQTSIAGFRD